MKLKVIQIGDPVLRQKARELSHEEILSPRIQQLIELMKETMYDAPGVGLAAPQIGESIQLIVIEDKPEYSQALTPEQIKNRQRIPVPFHVVINPKVTVENNDGAEFYEGCLSVTGHVGLVTRALSLKVDCLNEHAKPITLHATGWYARILQHETDHLQGILCIDKMKTQSITTLENYSKFLKITAK